MGEWRRWRRWRRWQRRRRAQCKLLVHDLALLHCSAGLIAAVCRALSQTRVHALIRPRPGDFLYSREELAVMRQDVLHAASCGAHGVVLGMLTPGGTIDQDQLRPFTDLCLALGWGGAGGWCGCGSIKRWCCSKLSQPW